MRASFSIISKKTQKLNNIYYTTIKTDNSVQAEEKMGERKEDRRRLVKNEDEEICENLIYGRNAVIEALKSEREFDKIFIKKGTREGSLSLITSMAKEKGIPVLDASVQKLDEITHSAVHQGVVATLSEIEFVGIESFYDDPNGLVVICDGICDPHNLGAVIRSAECAGASGIVIPKRRSASVNATAVKSSAGAVSLIPISKVTNISNAIDVLKEHGYFVYGAEAGGDDLYKTKLTGKVALVMGSEGEGISRLVKSKCDFIISIPMYGKVNSYNVSCAAAIILSEAARARHSEN